MILKLLSLALFATAAITTNAEYDHARPTNGRTTVAVLEFGKGGSVRKSTSTCPHTTVHGVTSFWANLHDMDPHGRRPKSVPPAGMTMVSDFFQKANGGIIVSLTGLNSLDMDSMTTLKSVLDSTSEKTNNNVIGQFFLHGQEATTLLRRTDSIRMKDDETFGALLEKSVKDVISSPKEENKVKALSLDLDSESKSRTVSASFADTQIAKMFETLTHQAESSGSTFVVHLVIEDKEGAFHSRVQHAIKEADTSVNTVREMESEVTRRLEEEGDGEENKNEGGSIYYGYGYYDANGEYYTPYRTIFQIQFFQVVLWSALGLLAILFMSLNKMMNMPLMPDTLLFGESAKMESD